MPRLTCTPPPLRQATLLLAETQKRSKYFAGFDFQQLLDLANELAVLNFLKGDKIIVENERATFFGVILGGSLAPVRAAGVHPSSRLPRLANRLCRHVSQIVNGKPLMPARETGELIGEMALFSGGKRNSDVVALSDGHIAVFQFAHLQQLKSTRPELAAKVIMQLARAALAKQLEGKGGDINTAPEHEVRAGLQELRQRQEQMPWVAAGGGGDDDDEEEESLLQRTATLSRPTRGASFLPAARHAARSQQRGPLPRIESGEGLPLGLPATPPLDLRKRKESAAAQRARLEAGEAEAAESPRYKLKAEEGGRLMSEASPSPRPPPPLSPPQAREALATASSRPSRPSRPSLAAPVLRTPRCRVRARRAEEATHRTCYTPCR